MATNGNGNGNGQTTELDVLEARIRDEFPLNEPDALYRLLVRQAARTELYHRAVESTVEDISALRETVRRLPCAAREVAEPACPEGSG